MEIIEIMLAVSLMSIPASIGLSIIIGTIYYNKDYYLKTKIKYLQEKNKIKK